MNYLCIKNSIVYLDGKVIDKTFKNYINELSYPYFKSLDSIRNSTVDISHLTDEQIYEDNTKREAMQMIIDNQDNFEPEVVDKALEDLNSQMHQPLVSEEDLAEAASAAQADDGVPIYDGTAKPIDPNELLNGNV